MKKLKEFKVILWDFDGVILDSMPIRNKGFELVLSNYPKEQVNQLMEFHLKNGGLSRYVKFRYFFENVRKESITEEKIMALAASFSEIMLNELKNPDLLIQDSLEFIKKNHSTFNMHIVSGSDGNELRKICEALDIAKYFISINGSPTPKIKLVSDLIFRYNYSENDIMLIGDSMNDYDAAKANNINFYGYNNPSLNHLNYIEKFS